MRQTLQLLDYLATQEGTVITYHISHMILAAHSDASYLSIPQACSHAGSHFFLSSDADIPPNNGAVLVIAYINKHVTASATEAEIAALYITACEAVYIHIILQELGHAQLATPLQTDNSMAKAVINGKKYSPNVPKPRTSVFTGYMIMNVKISSTFIGDGANSTTPIIGLDISQHPIIVPHAGNSSHH
jgi:hypothetical protein